VIPAFMARVDIPEKGQATTRYMKSTREVVEALVSRLNPPIIYGSSEFSVELVDWDRDGEEKIVADVLYASSDCSGVELRQLVDRMSSSEKDSVLTAYIGERENRRHKPGRAFEAATYHFEVICDYANFRDLQRHRMLTIDWQRITPDHGFTTPGIVTDTGAESAWLEAIDAASSLYLKLKGTVGRDVAQYVLPFSSKVRFYLRMNAREAMHFIELRTARQGHTQYRQVCHRMVELIRDKAGHKAVASAMSFADMVPDYELSRLDGERRAERRRSGTAS
jgi:hypothetical protein